MYVSQALLLSYISTLFFAFYFEGGPLELPGLALNSFCSLERPVAHAYFISGVCVPLTTFHIVLLVPIEFIEADQVASSKDGMRGLQS